MYFHLGRHFLVTLWPWPFDTWWLKFRCFPDSEYRDLFSVICVHVKGFPETTKLCFSPHPTPTLQFFILILKFGKQTLFLLAKVSSDLYLKKNPGEIPACPSACLSHSVGVTLLGQVIHVFLEALMFCVCCCIDLLCLLVLFWPSLIFFIKCSTHFYHIDFFPWISDTLSLFLL